MGWYRDYYFLVELITMDPEEIAQRAKEFNLKEVPLNDDYVKKQLTAGGYTLPDEKCLDRCIVLYCSEKRGDISWLLGTVTQISGNLEGRARVLRAVTKYEYEDVETESYPIGITLEY